MRGFDGMRGVAESGPKNEGGDCATGPRDVLAGYMNSEYWVGSRSSRPWKKGFVLGERRCCDCHVETHAGGARYGDFIQNSRIHGGELRRGEELTNRLPPKP